MFFNLKKWGFPILSYYLHHFKLRDEAFMSPFFTHLISCYMGVFRLYFTLFRVKTWSSHIFLDILCDKQSSINRAESVKRLETCLSPSSTFSLSLSLNHETLKIINSQVFLLGVMYCRFPLTHEVIRGEFNAIERLNLKYALTPLSCQSHRDKWFEIHVFFACHFVL
jgi:hypothetical protein